MPSPSDSESMNELGAILVNALDLPVEQRADFLDEVCRSKPELRAEVESLIASYEKAPGYFGELADGLLPTPSDVDFSPAPDQHDPYHLVGQTLTHFKILDVLGGGGMGVVYRAEDTNLKRTVALKFLPPYLNQHPDAKHRFMLEAQAASALDHPNICTIFEVGETPGGPVYIAMAYYEGETLQRKIARGALPVDEAIDLALQMARGLAKAHAQGIVHRDVKPANVIVTGEGVVKILDFGLAKLTGGTQITRTGATMGTAAYMSPEQARGETVDYRTDIWSLGAVLYEMLAGERPFPGELAPAVVYAVLNQEPRPITGLVSGLPMQLSVVIDKALAKQVEARYQHMQDLEEDLQALLERKAARSMAEMEVLPPRPAPEPLPAFTATDEEAPVQILVVDDEPELELLIRQKFRRQIRSNEWTFVFASNGREALDILRTNPTLSLVLTDINMPHMDGLTLLTHIAELKRPIKTVVVSAYGDLSNIRVAMNRGAFDFVTKPIDFQDLEATVQKTHRELQAYYKATEAQRQLVSLQKEFEVARRIQEAILPLSFPKRDDVDLYAFMTTAREVGGTFYDFFDVGDDRIGFIIGDVVGKGVPAALFMAMSQTFLKGIALEGQDPGACLTTMNHLLFPEGFPDLFVTVYYGLLNTASGELAYCNAGHPAPYVLLRGEQVAPLEGRDDAPIWQARDHKFSTHTTTLQPDEGLLLYTQGVTGAVDTHGHPYSAERLASLLRQVHADPPAEQIRSVVRGVMQHAEDLQDDLTVLALRYLRPGA